MKGSYGNLRFKKKIRSFYRTNKETFFYFHKGAFGGKNRIYPTWKTQINSLDEGTYKISLVADDFLLIHVCKIIKGKTVCEGNYDKSYKLGTTLSTGKINIILDNKVEYLRQ